MERTVTSIASSFPRRPRHEVESLRPNSGRLVVAAILMAAGATLRQCKRRLLR
jgi:hypothetical protein